MKPRKEPSRLRRVLENWSRGVVFTRRLRTRRGFRRVQVTPEASLVYWLPGSLNKEQSLCGFADRYIGTGAKVWDVGANIGVFSFLAAANAGATGAVLSIEADPYISQLLIRSSLDLAQDDAIPQIVTAAVADEIKLADFGVAERSRASNHLLSSTGCTQTGGLRFSFKVPCLTLDWLLERTFAPEIVKMDIEGVEAVALSCASQLLSKVRPVFHLEVWSEVEADVRRILQAHDYLFYDGERDLGLRSPVTSPTWCTIAVPCEKRSNLVAAEAM
jgi:FkbM family methyltransferase